MRFARDLAGFLTALQAIGAAGGPLAPLDEQTRRTAEELRGLVDGGRLSAVIDFGCCVHDLLTDDER